MREHPPVAALLCAEMFPVETSRIDSTNYLSSKRRADSLFTVIEQQRILDSASAANTIEIIDRLRLDSMNRYNISLCDSLNEELYRYAASEKRRADNLQNKVKEVQSAVNNIEPRIEYVRDKAQEAVLENKLTDATGRGDRLASENDALKIEAADWKGKAKTRWWFLWIIIVAAGVIIFRKSIFSLIKGVFMKVFFYLLAFMAMFSFSSCSTFKDDPTVSVWAEGGWLLFWLPFLASIGFLWFSYKQSRSGSSKQNSLGRTIYSDKNVSIFGLWRFRVGVILLIFSIGLVIYFNSGWHR